MIAASRHSSKATTAAGKEESSFESTVCGRVGTYLTLLTLNFIVIYSMFFKSCTAESFCKYSVMKTAPARRLWGLLLLLLPLREVEVSRTGTVGGVQPTEILSSFADSPRKAPPFGSLLNPHPTCHPTTLPH